MYRASNDFVYNVVKSNVLSEPKPHGDQIYGLWILEDQARPSLSSATDDSSHCCDDNKPMINGLKAESSPDLTP